MLEARISSRNVTRTLNIIQSVVARMLTTFRSLVQQYEKVFVPFYAALAVGLCKVCMKM